MIPLPFWLTNIQFVISAFAVFTFFSAAWLNIDSWVVRKEFKTGLRALGFLLLAGWGALKGIGSLTPWLPIVEASLLLAGLLTITLSYLADRLPLKPKELARLREQEEAEQVAAVTNEVAAAERGGAEVTDGQDLQRGKGSNRYT